VALVSYLTGPRGRRPFGGRRRPFFKYSRGRKRLLWLFLRECWAQRGPRARARTNGDGLTNGPRFVRPWAPAGYRGDLR